MEFPLSEVQLISRRASFYLPIFVPSSLNYYIFLYSLLALLQYDLSTSWFICSSQNYVDDFWNILGKSFKTR